MRFLRILVSALTLCFGAVAADPFVGTWKMNPEKSTFAGLTPRRKVMRFEPHEYGLRYSDETTTAEGVQVTNEGILNFDGKEHPALNPEFIAHRTRVSTESFQALLRRKDENHITHRLTYVISPDGNTLTLVSVS